MAATECACCTTDITDGGYRRGGRVFCDYGCAEAYSYAGNKPVDEWPADWPPE